MNAGVSIHQAVQARSGVTPSAAKTALNALKLDVDDGVEFAFKDAQATTAFLKWSNASVNWTDGQKVSLELTQ